MLWVEVVNPGLSLGPYSRALFAKTWLSSVVNPLIRHPDLHVIRRATTPGYHNIQFQVDVRIQQDFSSCQLVHPRRRYRL